MTKAPPAQPTKNACLSCLVAGHTWWECTAKTGRALSPQLKKALAEWSANGGKGKKGQKGKGKGGKCGKGEGQGADGAATPPGDAEPRSDRRRQGQPGRRGSR